MVHIRLPPPERDPSPLYCLLPADSGLARIFDPTDHDQTATSFRRVGPIKRFDHHRSFGHLPALDPERGIYYAAFTLEAALVEVFGDNGPGRIEPGEKHVAYVTLTRDFRLLDLRGKGEDNGAWRAGTVAALSKNAEYAPSQAWSRYFYEHPERYAAVDGIIYSNAHNEDDACALYERGDSLECRPENIIRLDDPDFRTRLLVAALRTQLRLPLLQ